MISIRSWTVVALVLAAAFSRLLPHPDNVAPIAALAIFAGATFDSRRWAPVVALGALLLSNTLFHLTYLAGWQGTVGFYPGQWAVYAATLIAVGYGELIRRRRNVATIAGATVAGSVTFFLITNLALVYGEGSLYPATLQGVLASYVAGLPFFFKRTLAGDAFYSTVLFGGFALAEVRFPATRRAIAE